MTEPLPPRQMDPPDFYEPMEVQRVKDFAHPQQRYSGSHIEPPLEDRWYFLQKLQWHAGALKADTGLKTRIVYWPYEGMYDLVVGGHSYSPLPFSWVWDKISMISRSYEYFAEQGIVPKESDI